MADGDVHISCIQLICITYCIRANTVHTAVRYLRAVNVLCRHIRICTKTQCFQLLCSSMICMYSRDGFFHARYLVLPWVQNIRMCEMCHFVVVAVSRRAKQASLRLGFKFLLSNDLSYRTILLVYGTSILSYHTRYTSIWQLP